MPHEACCGARAYALAEPLLLLFRCRLCSLRFPSLRRTPLNSLAGARKLSLLKLSLLSFFRSFFFFPSLFSPLSFPLPPTLYSHAPSLVYGVSQTEKDRAVQQQTTVAACQAAPRLATWSLQPDLCTIIADAPTHARWVWTQAAVCTPFPSLSFPPPLCQTMEKGRVFVCAYIHVYLLNGGKRRR